MTLQEKFKQWLDTDPRLQIREVQLEVIADDFAIGFAEWCAYYQIGQVKDGLWISHLLRMAGHNDIYTMIQLIERFKKEKGL